MTETPTPYVLDGPQEIAPGIIVTRLAGIIPVEGEGLIDELPYYFHARGGRWQLAVAATPDGDPLAVMVPPRNRAAGTILEGLFGDGHTSAFDPAGAAPILRGAAALLRGGLTNARRLTDSMPARVDVPAMDARLQDGLETLAALTRGYGLAPDGAIYSALAAVLADGQTLLSEHSRLLAENAYLRFGSRVSRQAIQDATGAEPPTDMPPGYPYA